MKMMLKHRYLVFTGAESRPMLKLSIYADGELIESLYTKLGTVEGEVAHEYFVDMAYFQGKDVEITLEECTDALYAGNFDALAEGELGRMYDFIRNDASAPADTAKYRPLVRYTPQCGWMNDPNGCIYHQGKYHLGYQYSPGTTFPTWGINWGHAVSDNLFDWVDQEPIIRTAANSGAAWVRADNGHLCVCHGMGMMESRDGGYHYEKLPSDFPFVGDPKIFYHPETQRYVMVAQRPEPAGVRDFNTLRFYTSVDLKQWTLEGEISGFHECPDMFRVPVAADGSEKWILTCGNGSYRIGEFDGHVFHPDPIENERLDYYADAPFPDLYYMVYGNHAWADKSRGIASHRGEAYAFQVFQNMPKGRCVRIGWMFVYFASQGEGYNQCLTVPHELSLRQTGVGMRLCAQPVEEIRGLYELQVSDARHVSIEGKAIDCEVSMDDCQSVRIGKFVFRYLAEEKRLQVIPDKAPAFTIPHQPLDSRIKIRSVWDVGTVEFYIGEGEIYLPLPTGEYNRERLNIDVEGDGNSCIEAHALRRAVYKH